MKKLFGPANGTYGNIAILVIVVWALTAGSWMIFHLVNGWQIDTIAAGVITGILALVPMLIGNIDKRFPRKETHNARDTDPS